MTQAEKAERLLALHHGEDPLVLINAWDTASACIVEEAGFPAIATSSAGVTNALGYPDGEKIPWQEMQVAITRIANAVRVPVTADTEAGLADTPEELEKKMESLSEAGAVGVNLEDLLPHHKHRSLFSLSDQLARIQAARKAGEKCGVHLVINARTDAYWQPDIAPEEALRNTLERGKAYLKAGGDCIFVPGLRDPAHIRTVVGELNAPVNILATTGAPSIPELKQLGVKRVSYGSGPMRAAMGLLRRIAHEAQTTGTYTALLEGAVPYPQMNAFFER